MDPEECARRIVEASTVGERLEALADLEGWGLRQGFFPRGRRWRHYWEMVGHDEAPSASTLLRVLDGSSTIVGGIPTVDALASDLRGARDDWRGDAESRERDPETGERFRMDVRLQVSEDGWELHTGEACFDQDHRGSWGASSVGARDSLRTLREIAADLIGEVLESAWMSEEVPEEFCGVDVAGLAGIAR